jgi:hypothetical protein
MSQQLEGNQHLPNPIHSALGAKIMWSCGLYVEANKLYSSSEVQCSASILRVKKYYCHYFTVIVKLTVLIMLPRRFALLHNLVSLLFEQTILSSARVL